MVLALVLAQEILPVRLRLDQIEAPITVPAAEILHGLLKRPTNALRLKIDNERRAWDIAKQKPVNWEDVQVGTFASRVVDGLLGSTPCKVLEINATRTQVVLDRRKEEHGFRYRADRSWFVTDAGKVLGEDYRLSTDFGVWAFKMRWNDDETYTVTLEEPGRAKRSLGPVTPGQDITELRESLFKPMLTLPKEFSTKKKEFWWYDPWNGGFKKAAAEFYDTFDGIYWDKKWKGTRVDVKGVHPERFRAYMSEEGWYLRADLDGYFFLHREEEPDKSSRESSDR